MKLVSKYNQYIISFMIVIFLISSAFSYYFINEVIKRERDEELHSIQSRIKKYVNEYNTIPFVSVVNDQKIEFIKTKNIIDKPIINTVQAFYNYKNKKHISRQLLYTMVIKDQLYKVTITDPIEGTSHMTGLIFEITILTISGLLITTLLINQFVVKKLWSPFYQTIHEVSQFDLNQSHKLNFPNSPIHEFNFMIRTLETVTGKAAENFKVLKEFTENASHELQTPLAIIRSKLDILVQHEGLSKDETASLSTAYGAIKKLSRLNKDLLLITKIDNNQFKPKLNIDVKYKLEEKIQQFRELWALDQIEIKTNLNESHILANPDLLEILISNVLSNATKHNVPKGLIYVQLSLNKLKIINSGILNPLDTKRLFKRFYKGSEQNGNNGLGLSIVWQICEVSGIKVSYAYDYDKHAFTFDW